MKLFSLQEQDKKLGSFSEAQAWVAIFCEAVKFLCVCGGDSNLSLLSWPSAGSRTTSCETDCA